jgi:hypothetical protein
MLISVMMTILCTTLSISVHLFTLRRLWSVGEPRLRHASGVGIGLMVLGCMVSHVVEISIFAFGIFILAADYDDLRLAEQGLQEGGLNLWFYSAMFYTSVGGPSPREAGLRFFVACEAVAGLVLVTWTASFLFLLMQRFWVPHEHRHSAK